MLCLKARLKKRLPKRWQLGTGLWLWCLAMPLWAAAPAPPGDVVIV